MPKSKYTHDPIIAALKQILSRRKEQLRDLEDKKQTLIKDTIEITKEITKREKKNDT